jgi:hypothetical protein
MRPAASKSFNQPQVQRLRALQANALRLLHVTRIKKMVPPLGAGDLHRPPACDSAQWRQASAAESGSPQIKQPPSSIPLRS